MRQSHYDTAYGSDGKGEEWLADKFRVALELNGSLILALPDGMLVKPVSNQLTIEFWARGGLKFPKQGDFLAAVDEKGQMRLRIQLPDETGQVVWQAGLKPDDGPLDALVYANTNPKDYRGAWTRAGTIFKTPARARCSSTKTANFWPKTITLPAADRASSR